MYRYLIANVTVLLMAMAAVFSINGQSINITGTIIDSITSQNVSGALIKLVEYPQFTTTSVANGTFTLTGSPTAVRADQISNSSADAISVQGDRLTIEFMQMNDVQIDVFNSLGSCVYHKEAKASGIETLQYNHLWQAPGVYYVKVKIGSAEKILKCSGKQFSHRADYQRETIRTLSKRSAAYTLQVEKSGYVTKQISVSALTADVGTIKLHATSSNAPLFFDDFTGSSVDATKWSVINRLSDQVNGELDGCIPANVRVSGGILMLDQKHEDVTIGDAIEAPKLMHYTTGHIQQKTAAFKYGTIEIRAKIPGGTGLWPCIWMLGYQWQASQPATANTPGHNWPHDGWCEIDIGEFWQNERNAVSNGCHWQTGDGIHNGALPYNATTRFMVYRLQWQANSLVWSVDPEDGTGFRTLRTISDPAGIPNVAMYVVLSCPVGGSGGGTPNPATLPQTMTIDWVRITQ